MSAILYPAVARVSCSDRNNIAIAKAPNQSVQTKCENVKLSKLDVLDTFDTVCSEPRTPLLLKADVLHTLQDLEFDAPFTDYLVAHGAIDSKIVKELLNASDSPTSIRLRTELLIDFLGIFQPQVPTSTGEYGQILQNHKLILLVNALRSTGQHVLASKLDCSRKIAPAPWTCPIVCTNGDCEPAGEIGPLGDVLNPIRRRGQLRLWLQVAAIKVEPALYESLPQPFSAYRTPGRWPKNPSRAFYANAKRTCTSKTEVSSDNGGPIKDLLEKPHATSYWIDLESIHRVVTSNSCSSSDHRPSNLDNFVSGIESTTKKPRGCFAFLNFRSRKRKRHEVQKKKFSTASNQPPNSPSLTDYRLPSSVLTPSAPQPPETSSTSADLDIEAAKFEELRTVKLSFLDAKSNDLYASLSEAASPLHDALVKFLEQTSGVLVLGCVKESRLPAGTVPGDYLPAAALQPASALSVSIVATTREAVRRLFSSVTIEAGYQSSDGSLATSSLLSDALESCLSDAGVLEVLGLQALRLGVALQAEEIRRVIGELED